MLSVLIRVLEWNLGCFFGLDIVVPLSYLALIILLPDFVEPVSWWPPLVERCHCMQFSGLARRAPIEQ